MKAPQAKQTIRKRIFFKNLSEKASINVPTTLIQTIVKEHNKANKLVSMLKIRHNP
jgi:hypothetical protein